jgi:hypothetical protein
MSSDEMKGARVYLFIMSALITSFVVATFVVAVSAQDSIVFDLSQMKGSSVAMDAKSLTNKLVLYLPAHDTTLSTNVSRVHWPVDGVVKQLRDQGDMANLVKKLVESGDVCAVVGHRWESSPHVTLEYRPDGSYPQHRKCDLCGKVQTKQPGEWQ